MNNGKEHQIKWNEVLTEFAGLNVERMIVAMSMISPAKIDSIIDAAERAKERSKTRHFESFKAKLLSEGVDVTEFLDYLTAPKVKASEVSKSKSRRFTKEERQKIDGKLRYWIEEGCTSPKDLHSRLLNEGFDVAYNTIASKSLEIRKKIEEAA